MEQVIKVLLQFCKDYCGKSAPSKKEIAAVLSRLEKEGCLATPEAVLNNGLWDSFTMKLAQRVMSSPKKDKNLLKNWGLILGALKAAKEDKETQYTAQKLVGLAGRVGQGGSLEMERGEVRGVCASPTDGRGCSPATEAPPEPRNNQRTMPRSLNNPYLTASAALKESPPPYPRWNLYPALPDEGGGGGGTTLPYKRTNRVAREEGKANAAARTASPPEQYQGGGSALANPPMSVTAEECEGGGTDERTLNADWSEIVQGWTAPPTSPPMEMPRVSTLWDVQKSIGAGIAPLAEHDQLKGSDLRCDVHVSSDTCQGAVVWQDSNNAWKNCCPYRSDSQCANA
ncbi:uncharacterized protein LOC110389809 [Numida meleagris]|uniref:uncharacterized protein LOC110389809 n=1 Tax=Numida meleagris TaxID=8996 RepID=UPI000B3D7EBE|nr:uncharacterized protein LOC110389809 [Numida meleagris]